jgi:hypothetical protein
MGLLDRLLGRDESQSNAYRDTSVPRPAQPASGGAQRQPRSDDEVAIERYRYLLRTAPPEQLEQVHAEAFAKLTPEQRQQVYTELSNGAAAGEAPRSDRPEDLARSATRSEVRDPGFMERSFGGQRQGGGMGFGSMLGASLLGTIGGYVIGSALMSAFMPDMDGSYAEGFADGEASGGDAAGADAGDAAGADMGWGDGGGFDGGGFGDFGGDF